MEQDETAAEVAAMQFAGGMSIEHVAALWERDVEWVVRAIRQSLLASIPIRDGGTKASRAATRAERVAEIATVEKAQVSLFD